MIDGKIDEPATEGTSGQVLTIDGDGGRTWADAVGEEVYSTTEQRIGTWMGKPLYRKVVNVTMPNNEIKQTAHNIQNIDVITNIKGITVSSDVNTFIPIITANTGDNSYALQTWADKIYIYVRSGVDYAMQTGFVILEYTKTTD